MEVIAIVYCKRGRREVLFSTRLLVRRRSSSLGRPVQLRLEELKGWFSNEHEQHRDLLHDLDAVVVQILLWTSAVCFHVIGVGIVRLNLANERADQGVTGHICSGCATDPEQRSFGRICSTCLVSG